MGPRCSLHHVVDRRRFFRHRRSLGNVVFLFWSLSFRLSAADSAFLCVTTKKWETGSSRWKKFGMRRICLVLWLLCFFSHATNDKGNKLFFFLTKKFRWTESQIFLAHSINIYRKISKFFSSKSIRLNEYLTFIGVNKVFMSILEIKFKFLYDFLPIESSWVDFFFLVIMIRLN